MNTPKSPETLPQFTNHMFPLTLEGPPNFKLENCGLLLDQYFIYPFFGQTFISTSKQTAPDVQQRDHSKRQLTS